MGGCIYHYKGCKYPHPYCYWCQNSTNMVFLEIVWMWWWPKVYNITPQFINISIKLCPQLYIFSFFKLLEGENYNWLSDKWDAKAKERVWPVLA